MILAARRARPPVAALATLALLTMLSSAAARGELELLEEQSRADVRVYQERRVVVEGLRGTIVARAGPWQSAGEWWAETAWAREEWDVAFPDGTACRLVQDRATGAWAVDAIYD